MLSHTTAAALPGLLSQIVVCALSCAGCRTTRLKAACSMYVMQHTALVLSALSALVSLQSHQGSAVFWTGVACTIGFGSVSSIGAQGSTLSVEKEWTVVLCNGNSAALAKVNSGSASALLAYCVSCCCMHQKLMLHAQGHDQLCIGNRTDLGLGQRFWQFWQTQSTFLYFQAFTGA